MEKETKNKLEMLVMLAAASVCFGFAGFSKMKKSTSVFVNFDGVVCLDSGKIRMDGSPSNVLIFTEDRGLIYAKNEDHTFKVKRKNEIMQKYDNTYGSRNVVGYSYKILPFCSERYVVTQIYTPNKKLNYN